MLLEISGQTLGIVGFGRIGQAVASRAEGFAMRVMHTTARDGPDALDELLRASDFVSLHTPLTHATRHLIDAAALRKMKPTAILINTARGEIIDQPALIQALQEGEIAGAALDVTNPEPPAEDDPLLNAPNLVLTPHIAWYAPNVLHRQFACMADEIARFFQGESLRYELTPQLVAIRQGKL